MGIPLWRDPAEASAIAASSGVKNAAGSRCPVASQHEYRQLPRTYHHHHSQQHLPLQQQQQQHQHQSQADGDVRRQHATPLGPWERRLMRLQEAAQQAVPVAASASGVTSAPAIAPDAASDVPVRVINNASGSEGQLTTRLHEIERRLRQVSPNSRLPAGDGVHSSSGGGGGGDEQQELSSSSPRSASRRNVARYLGGTTGMSANEAEHRAVLARLARHIVRSPLGSREYQDEVRDFRYAQLYLTELHSLRQHRPSTSGSGSGSASTRAGSERRASIASAMAVRMERSSDSNEEDDITEEGGMSMSMDVDVDADDDRDERQILPSDLYLRTATAAGVHEQLLHADRFLHDQLRASAEHAPDASTFDHPPSASAAAGEREHERERMHEREGRSVEAIESDVEAAASTLQGQLEHWRRTRQMQHDRVERLAESAHANRTSQNTGAGVAAGTGLQRAAHGRLPDSAERLVPFSNLPGVHAVTPDGPFETSL